MSARSAGPVGAQIASKSSFHRDAIILGRARRSLTQLHHPFAITWSDSTLSDVKSSCARRALSQGTGEAPRLKHTRAESFRGPAFRWRQAGN